MTFRESGALPASTILQGVIVGASLMVGALVGKAMVLRLSASAFQHLLDGLLFCSGLSLLWTAIH